MIKRVPHGWIAELLTSSAVWYLFLFWKAKPSIEMPEHVQHRKSGEGWRSAEMFIFGQLLVGYTRYEKEVHPIYYETAKRFLQRQERRRV